MCNCSEVMINCQNDKRVSVYLKEELILKSVIVNYRPLYVYIKTCYVL